MVRGAVVDRDELFETANQLEAEGKEVTALSVHKALGRGSLTTVYKYLEDWKSTRPAKTAAATTEMPELVKTAFATAWRAAAQEAARETETVKEKAEQAVKEMRGQFEEALEAIDKLEKEMEADIAALEALKEEVSSLQLKLSEEARERAAEKAAGEELRQKLKEQQSEIERLRKENERERAERDQAMKEAAENKGRLEELAKQNSELLKLFDQTGPGADKAIRKNK